MQPGWENSAAAPPESSRWQLPLRFRLAIWMIAIFLIVQLSIAFVFQLYQARAIEDFFSQRLTTRVDAAIAAIGDGLPAVTNQQLAQIASRHEGAQVVDEVTIDILDDQGQSIATSRTPPITLDAATLERAREIPDAFSIRVPPEALRSSSKEESPVRAAIHRVRGPDQRDYIIVLASNDAIARHMQTLTTTMIVMSLPIGIIPIALSSYLIAGLAVRPLADIRALARQLSPESINQFIDSASAVQEVAAVRKELEMARRRIEAGFSTQERFMSNVSHELKTPISVVLTESQALKLEGTPRPVRDFLKSMTEELEKLGRTVDNFLLLTRVRHGKGQIPALETCYARDVLLDSYGGCVMMASLHKVRLNLRIPEGEDEDASVIGNCELLRIIFDNIIRNAVRFSPPGGVVEIDATATPENVIFTVRDHGPGIPAELLPRVFDRFSQAPDEERRGRGHGLGLEIAMGIAELHSGTIAVRNPDDGGCEFAVTLPRAIQTTTPHTVVAESV